MVSLELTFRLALIAMTKVIYKKTNNIYCCLMIKYPFINYIRWKNDSNNISEIISNFHFSEFTVAILEISNNKEISYFSK